MLAELQGLRDAVMGAEEAPSSEAPPARRARFPTWGELGAEVQAHPMVRANNLDAKRVYAAMSKIADEMDAYSRGGGTYKGDGLGDRHTCARCSTRIDFHEEYASGGLTCPTCGHASEGWICTRNPYANFSDRPSREHASGDAYVSAQLRKPKSAVKLSRSLQAFSYSVCNGRMSDAELKAATSMVHSYAELKETIPIAVTAAAALLLVENPDVAATRKLGAPPPPPPPPRFACEGCGAGAHSAKDARFCCRGLQAATPVNQKRMRVLGVASPR